MMTDERMPIVEGLARYQKEKIKRFHMPGHKANGAWRQELEDIHRNMYAFDVTEVDGTDNLHMPQEMIAEAQHRLAEAFGASESLFLVNGSTSGMLAAILGLTERGDRVLVQRNCHQSVYHAMYLGGLRASYLYPEVSETFGFASGLSVKTVQEAVCRYPDAKVLILTYPTYYGTCCPLEEISNICWEHGVLLIVDEAHGAHFGFSELLPKTAMTCGADVSVNSLHKTLPALTQTAAIHFGKQLSERQRQKIRQMLRMVQTSSPSYLLLASSDAARQMMQTDGEQCFLELRKWIAELEQELAVIEGVTLLSERHLHGECHDFTRLVIRTPWNGEDLSAVLRKDYRIQVEMAEENRIVLIGTIADTKADYEHLARALKEIFEKSIPGVWEREQGSQKADLGKMPIPEEWCSPQRVEQYLWEVIPLREAIGEVSAEQIVPYPPGVPLLLPGEHIGEEVAAYLEELFVRGTKILKSRSTTDQMIAVIRQN